MDGIKLQTFKERYTFLYKSINNDSTDYFVFHEPYKGNYKKIEFMGDEYKVPKFRTKRESKDSLDCLHCNYYISSIDGYVDFFVQDRKTIRVKLSTYNPSYSTNLERWYDIAEKAEWKNLSDIKADFPTTDYVGNQHYVFDIRGNKYRLVVVVKFTIGHIFIRFVGTHSEYDKIDVSTI